VIVTLRYGRQVENQVVEPEDDPVVLQGKRVREIKGEKLSLLEPYPQLRIPLGCLSPKAPYLERLKALKKNA
jgi:hypothetical protein